MVVGKLWLLVLVGYVQQVVIFDFATDVLGKGVSHHLGSYKSEGRRIYFCEGKLGFIKDNMPRKY